LESRIRHKAKIYRSVVISFGVIALAVYAMRLTADNLAMVGLFALAAIISRLLDIRLPQGGKVHIDTAVIIASVLLFPLPQALLIIVVGVVVSMLVQRLKLKFTATMYPLSQLVLIVIAAAQVFYAAGGETGKIEPFYGITALVLLCGVYTFLMLGLDQLAISINRGTPYIPAFMSAVEFLAPFYLALSSLGVLLAIMYGGMAYWGLLIFFVPLLVTRLSFKSFLDIRRVYRKTIEALANTIEAQNPRRRGHGQRVASYSVDIGKEMGVHGRDLELIGYAALLHDIGMLGVDEDSLDHLLEQASAQSGEAPHAIIGAEIIEEVDFLKDAADMVRKHHFPIDKVGSPSELSLGARIINVASSFDKFTRADNPDERLTAYQAITRIKKDQAIVYDPKVVRSLINVLRKQGKLMEFVS